MQARTSWAPRGFSLHWTRAGIHTNCSRVHLPSWPRSHNKQLSQTFFSLLMHKAFYLNPFFFRFHLCSESKRRDTTFLPLLGSCFLISGGAIACFAKCVKAGSHISLECADANALSNKAKSTIILTLKTTWISNHILARLTGMFFIHSISFIILVLRHTRCFWQKDQMVDRHISKWWHWTEKYLYLLCNEFQINRVTRVPENRSSIVMRAHFPPMERRRPLTFMLNPR